MLNSGSTDATAKVCHLVVDNAKMARCVARQRAFLVIPNVNLPARRTCELLPLLGGALSKVIAVDVHDILRGDLTVRATLSDINCVAISNPFDGRASS